MQRRGWCLTGCGCSLEVPLSGALYVDCPGCRPPNAEPPAGHHHEDAAPPDPADDRPDPSATEDRRPAPVRVGRRSEQIIGRERDRIAARLRQRYLAGATSRDLATETGRSFGWVRTLLLETGTELRTRGGDHRTARHQGSETGR